MRESTRRRSRVFRVVASLVVGLAGVAVTIGGPALAWNGTGDYHSCAVRTDGTLWCWGENSYGQLGTGDTTDRSTPTRVGSLTTWASVETGADHTCAIRTDRTLWCWGYNSFGQVGIGNRTDQLTPAQVGTSAGWASVATSGFHTCALRTDGTLWCWGDNYYGQSGVGADAGATVTTPAQVGTATWASVGGGIRHTCAIRTDRTLWCWGANYYGQVGIGNEINQPTPVRVGTDTWASVSPGWYYHTCAIRIDGTLWCWGSIPGLTTSDRTVPTQVGSVTAWASVEAGGFQTCAIRTDGTLWCWGGNSFGQLGTGDSTDQSAPVQEGTAATTWAQVSTGVHHVCALRADRTLWCWGANGDGQLGTGDTTARSTPTRVLSDAI